MEIVKFFSIEIQLFISSKFTRLCERERMVKWNAMSFICSAEGNEEKKYYFIHHEMKIS